MRSTGVAVYGEIKFARMRDPIVEGVSFTQKTSLIVAGIPANGPGSSSAAIILSTVWACSCALASDRVMKACIFSASSAVSGLPSIIPGRPSTWRMRSRHDSSTSTADAFFDKIVSLISTADKSHSCIGFTLMSYGEYPVL